jgi:hypothetical protein
MFEASCQLRVFSCATGSNTDYGHKTAGEGAFFAVAEEEIGAAGGTKVADENIFGAKAGGEELRAIRFAQIEVDALGRRLVARGHHVEPLEGIGLFTGARLVEIAGGIRELRGELGDEVGGNFVAAGAYGRADGGEKIGRLAAVFVVHAANGFFGDARKSSFPTGVDGGDGTLFRVDEENWNAISGLDSKKQAESVCGGGIAFTGLRRRSGEGAEQGGVDLLQRGQGEVARSEGGLKLLAIRRDVFRRVPLYMTEIEQFFAVDRADAACASAETVDEPGEFGKRSEL